MNINQLLKRQPKPVPQLMDWNKEDQDEAIRAFFGHYELTPADCDFFYMSVEYDINKQIDDFNRKEV